MDKRYNTREDYEHIAGEYDRVKKLCKQIFAAMVEEDPVRYVKLMY